MNDLQTTLNTFSRLTRLSRRKNAELLGVSYTTLARWESGDTTSPRQHQSAEALRRMHDVLQFDLATGVISDLQDAPAKQRFEAIKTFIAGAIH